jgi:alkylation response protein AidB-like acyl-CoA dehydrogenase
MPNRSTGLIAFADSTVLAQRRETRHMSIAADGLGLALGGLRRLAGLEVLDRYGLRDRVEQLVASGTRTGFSAANTAGRRFAQASRAAQGGRSGQGDPARQAPTTRGDLFDLTPDDEQQMLVEAFRDLAAEQLRPAAREADDALAVPPKLRTMAAEMGAMVLGIPSDLGGVVDERSAVTAVLAMETLAHGDMGLAAGIMAPAAVASALALWGDADQQQTYLTPFTGDDPANPEPPIASLAIAEPRPLFDPTDLRTTARREGGDYVLTGLKALVSDVASTELLLVAAQVDGAGPGLFLVEAGTAGLSVRPEPTMGVRATASGEVALADVRVPASALLAAGDPAVYAEAIARSRIAWAALATGTAQAVLDYLIPYVKDRQAFGEPIAHRQGVAFTVANIAIELEGLRLATWRAAALADQGKPFAREAAIARQLATDKGVQIGSDGVQMLGGHGYVKEHPVERWYRDLRAAGLVDGVVLV